MSFQRPYGNYPPPPSNYHHQGPPGIPPHQQPPSNQYVGNSGNLSGGQTQHQPPPQYNRNVWNHPPGMAAHPSPGPPPLPPHHGQQHSQSNISPWINQNMPPHMNGLQFRGYQQSPAQQYPMDHNQLKHVPNMRMVSLKVLRIFKQNNTFVSESRK